jgi:uncharacterized protein (DUF342 family)
MNDASATFFEPVKQYYFERVGDEIFLAVSQGTHEEEMATVEDLLAECGFRQFGFAREEIEKIFDQADGRKVLLGTVKENMKLYPFVKVKTSGDLMEAWACVYKGLDPDLVHVTRQEIDGEIQLNAIKYGVIEEAVESLLTSEAYFQKKVIARGQPRIQGEDARIQFNFNPMGLEIRPVELEDGSVDYYNLDLIQVVEKDSVLVEKIPVVEGRPGITVRGNTLLPNKGKDARVAAGTNVRLSEEDGTKLYAGVSGHVVCKDGKVHVYPVFEVKEDVGFGTGNIRFPGNVIVRGNVQATFSVIAQGDVEIKGILEGYVEAGGHLKVGKGIVRGKARAKGNIFVHHVENGKVEAGGDLTVSEAILYSLVTARGNVSVGGKRGLISGGSIASYRSVSAKTIGSPLSTATEIILGVTKETLEEYQTLCKELLDLQKTDQKIQQVVTAFEGMKAQTKSPLPKDKQASYDRILLSRTDNQSKLNEYQRRKEELEFQLSHLDFVSLNILDVMYPGVTLTIGKDTLHLKDEVKHCTYRYLEKAIVQQIYSDQAAKRRR